jgi:hypothetical protein
VNWQMSTAGTGRFGTRDEISMFMLNKAIGQSLTQSRVTEVTYTGYKLSCIAVATIEKLKEYVRR